MEIGKAPRVKIISGRPAEVETAVNLLLDDYAIQTWAIGSLESGVTVTCILLNVAELAKAAARQQASTITIPRLNSH
jgi:hypothetical protein